MEKQTKTEWRPILCLDFDGVIHSYERGWQDGELYGTVTPGFFEWAAKAKRHFALVVYSSRSSDIKLRAEMVAWFAKRITDAYGLAPDRALRFDDFKFAHEKPKAFLTIDDRAVTFMGNWTDTGLDPATLRAFQPWNSPSHVPDDEVEAITDSRAEVERLTAMRVPTEAMLIAARDWSYAKYGKPIGDDAAIGCWQAMFDAMK